MMEAKERHKPRRPLLIAVDGASPNGASPNNAVVAQTFLRLFSLSPKFKKIQTNTFYGTLLPTRRRDQFFSIGAPVPRHQILLSVVLLCAHYSTPNSLNTPVVFKISACSF
jgi:hypothetical protein